MCWTCPKSVQAHERSRNKKTEGSKSLSHQHKFCEVAQEGFSEMATSRKIWADAENVFSTKLQKTFERILCKTELGIDSLKSKTRRKRAAVSERNLW